MALYPTLPYTAGTRRHRAARAQVWEATPGCGGSPFLDTLWTGVDEAIELPDCDVYSYKSDGEADPFGARPRPPPPARAPMQAAAPLAPARALKCAAVRCGWLSKLAAPGMHQRARVAAQTGCEREAACVDATMRTHALCWRGSVWRSSDAETKKTE